MRRHVNKIYKNNHEKYYFQDKHPATTELVVIKEGDDWLRARIMDISKSTFTVWLIDEGRKTKVTQSFMFRKDSYSSNYMYEENPVFIYRDFIHHKTLIYRNYLILKRMAEEIASYPAQARVGILSPKIKPVPKTSIEHVERIETATEKYLIGTVTEIKKVLRLDYPILEINLWQGNPVKIMSFYLHCFSNFRKLFFYQF